MSDSKTNSIDDSVVHKYDEEVLNDGRVNGDQDLNEFTEINSRSKSLDADESQISRNKTESMEINDESIGDVDKTNKLLNSSMNISPKNHSV